MVLQPEGLSLETSVLEAHAPLCYYLPKFVIMHARLGVIGFKRRPAQVVVRERASPRVA